MLSHPAGWPSGTNLSFSRVIVFHWLPGSGRKLAPYHPPSTWKNRVKCETGEVSGHSKRKVTPRQAVRSRLMVASHEARSILVPCRLQGMRSTLRPPARTMPTGAVPDMGFHSAAAARLSRYSRFAKTG